MSELDNKLSKFLSICATDGVFLSHFGLIHGNLFLNYAYVGQKHRREGEVFQVGLVAFSRPQEEIYGTF